MKLYCSFPLQTLLRDAIETQKQYGADKVSIISKDLTAEAIIRFDESITQSGKEVTITHVNFVHELLNDGNVLIFNGEYIPSVGSRATFSDWSLLPEFKIDDLLKPIGDPQVTAENVQEVVRRLKSDK